MHRLTAFIRENGEAIGLALALAGVVVEIGLQTAFLLSSPTEQEAPGPRSPFVEPPRPR